MSLDLVEAGRQVRIVAVKAGRGLQGRLAAMGLVPGTPLDVVLNSPGGPFVVSVRGSRIMLGQHMAGKIMVA